MEASIEHLSRGTLRHVDTLLMIVEPYFRSLETLGRMAPLAAELGVPTRVVVANKVRTDRDVAAIREYADRLDLDVSQTIPFDENVLEADRAGRAVIDFMADAPAVRAVDRLLESVIGSAIAPLADGTLPTTVPAEGTRGKSSVLRKSPTGCPWVELP